MTPRKPAEAPETRPYDPNCFPQATHKKMPISEYGRLDARQVHKRVRSHGDSTHLSVMDGEGDVVSRTRSTEGVFGAFAVTPELGFLYNDHMGSFEFEDVGHPYRLGPNAVPWASVAPTIAFRGGRPRLAPGSQGSERIAPAILQVLPRLRAGMSPCEAVEAPRPRCSPNGRVSLEAARMRSDLPARLRSPGFEVDIGDAFAFHRGCVRMAVGERDGCIGVADPRRDGSARGPAR